MDFCLLCAVLPYCCTRYYFLLYSTSIVRRRPIARSLARRRSLAAAAVGRPLAAFAARPPSPARPLARPPSFDRPPPLLLIISEWFKSQREHSNKETNPTENTERLLYVPYAHVLDLHTHELHS